MTGNADNAGRIDAAFSGALGAFSLDAAFQLPARGISALLGASGCGKTTILRCIAGLNRMQGRFAIDGDVWQAGDMFRPPHRRPVGYVFQEASLFPHLSVRRNLLFGASRRNDASNPLLSLDDVVRLLGCRHLLDRSVGALSGGERQRIAIGRALLSQPRLLLMDEPLSALDRRSKDEILSFLERLPGELSIPVLYVSHDVSEVSRLAEHVVVLDAGRTVAAGSISEIMERIDLQPHTGRFEAGVVLTVRVVGEDERYCLTRLDHHGQTITIPRIAAPVGATVRLRVRARDVALSLEKPVGTSFRNALAGRIADIRAEPDTAYAEALIDIGGAALRARLTREAVDELSLTVGTPVYALVKSITFDRHAIS